MAKTARKAESKEIRLPFSEIQKTLHHKIAETSEFMASVALTMTGAVRAGAPLTRREIQDYAWQISDHAHKDLLRQYRDQCARTASSINSVGSTLAGLYGASYTPYDIKKDNVLFGLDERF